MSLNHQHRDIRIRAAGVMMLGRKIKLTEVAVQLSMSGQSIYNWAHAWREFGIGGLLVGHKGGLLVGHKGGRPRSLSEAIIATAIEAAGAELMTLRQIAQRVEEAHGVPFPCRLDTLSTALKRAGFSYKRGRYSLKKRNSEEFAVKASTLAKLQQAALDGACQLFYFDQSGFSAFHHNIDRETIDRWFLEHRMVLFYLRPTAPS